MYRYLVTRAEALKTPNNKRYIINTSECWPCIIESEHLLEYDQVVDEVYRQYFHDIRGYTGPTGRAFLVVQLTGNYSSWVRYRPKAKEYNIEVVPYGGD